MALWNISLNFSEVIEVDKKPVGMQLKADDYVVDFQLASV